VDELAYIKAVPQHSVAALSSTQNGARLPRSSPRSPHAFCIEALRDLARGLARRILSEDATDDRRLVRVDFPEASDELPPLVDAVGCPVSVGETGRRAPFGYPALLGPLDIVREFLPLLLVEQSLDGPLECIDLAVAQGEQPRSTIVQAIADVVGVALVSRNPAARVGKHLVDAAGFHAREQCIHARTLAFRRARSAPDGRVAEHVDHSPALLLRALHAHADLVLNRPAVLKLAAVPCVNQSAHADHHRLAIE
jgi:hypothetical protein